MNDGGGGGGSWALCIKHMSHIFFLDDIYVSLLKPA